MGNITEKTVFRAMQKKEAEKRIRLLGVMPEVIKAFSLPDDKPHRLYYSERGNKTFPAILYWIDNDEKYVKIVKDFEEEYNALVYHAQLTHFEFGRCLSLFYVSDCEEEWEYDIEDLENKQAVVYTVNLDEPDMSEFGSIGFKPVMGGVERTW